MGQGLGRLLLDIGLQDLAIQLGCGAAAIALKTEKFYDFSGSCTYAYLVLYTLRKHAGVSFPPKRITRPLINSSLVLIWAARLGSFLLSRILEDGRDSRFDKVRNNPPKFLFYWAIQALWIFLTALPVWVLNCKEAKKNEAHDDVTLRDKLGWSTWVVGFALQVVADSQKTAFKRKETSKGQFINDGLWALAQHPNYGGEILMWAGIFLSASSKFNLPETFLASISPAFVSFLLLNVSGVPLQRRANLRKWGKDPKYIKYLQDTPVLWPFVSFPKVPLR